MQYASDAEHATYHPASLFNALFNIATSCIQNTNQTVSKNSAQRAKNV